MAPGVGYLKRMWVSGSLRGLGFGRRMLGALEAEARELGFTTLRLETNRALGEAIRLYRTAGYEEVAPFNDEPYAHHWFEKRLS
jgi:ribosomal protein S18 acetylase RimI-like enzyme